MAKLKKSAVKKLTKATKGVSLLGKAKAKVGAVLGGGVAAKGMIARGGRRRRKHGAMWYAREIARIKLKRRYEKIRLRV